MGNAHRLVKAMQRVSTPKENDIVDAVTGKVTSVDPLKIKVGDIELTETFLVVGALCQETIIKIPEREEDKYEHVHEVPEHETEIASAGPYPHTHIIKSFDTKKALPDILLWRGLEVDDEVYLIRFSLGQKYLVLQRKEGIT